MKISKISKQNIAVPYGRHNSRPWKHSAAERRIGFVIVWF